MFSEADFYRVARQVWWRHRERWLPLLIEEDAVQEAVLHCWQRSSSYDPNRAQECTFYFIVCKSAMTAMLKKASRKKRGHGRHFISLDERDSDEKLLSDKIAGDEPDPSISLEEMDTLSSLLEFVPQLSPRQQTALRGLMAGRLLREDARVMHCTSERVRQLRQEALARLRLAVGLSRFGTSREP